jgi:hypothetical protein
MLHFMERSTIYSLKYKGWTNVQIAEFTGHHRDTIARVLREEVDKQPQPRQRVSAVAVFDAQITSWLDKDIPVIRMLPPGAGGYGPSLSRRRNGVLRLRAQGASCSQAIPAQPGAAL